MSRTLTPKQSLVLYMVWVHGMSQRQIARMLGCTQPTIWKLYHRGLDAMADRVDPRDRAIAMHVCREAFSLWGDPAPRQEPRFVALRREGVAADLEAQIEHRAGELSATAEAMAGDVNPPIQRNKGTAWTDWEIRYFMAHPNRTTIPALRGAAINCPAANGMKHSPACNVSNPRRICR